MSYLITATSVLLMVLLSGYILGYAHGHRRRPLRRKPIPPQVVSERLVAPPPVTRVPIPDAAPIRLQTPQVEVAPPAPPRPAAGRDRMFASWLRNERGVETVEWAAVAALIVAAALVVVTVEIGPGINDAGHLLRLLLVGIF